MLSLATQVGRKGRAVLAACALAGLAAAAGCTSAGGQPSWAGALGSGVTVDSSAPASSGNGSPQQVMIGVATAFSTGHFIDLCNYIEPSQRSGCTSWWGSPTLGSDLDLAQMPTFRNAKPGYTAIDGDRALIGFTGTECVLKQYPSCFTNNDPAALLDSGKSFSTLWSQSLMATSGSYSLCPAIKVNGDWYAYTANSSIVMF